MCEVYVRIVCCAFRKIPSGTFPPVFFFFFFLDPPPTFELPPGRSFSEKNVHPLAGGSKRILRQSGSSMVLTHSRSTV